MKIYTFTHEPIHGQHRLAMSFRRGKVKTLAVACRLVSLKDGTSAVSCESREVEGAYLCGTDSETLAEARFPQPFLVLPEPIMEGEYHFSQGKASVAPEPLFYATLMKHIWSEKHTKLMIRLDVSRSLMIENSVKAMPHVIVFDLDYLRARLEIGLARHADPALAALMLPF